jgi:hypothetical protein
MFFVCTVKRIFSDYVTLFLKNSVPGKFCSNQNLNGHVSNVSSRAL